MNRLVYIIIIIMIIVQREKLKIIFKYIIIGKKLLKKVCPISDIVKELFKL